MTRTTARRDGIGEVVAGVLMTVLFHGGIIAMVVAARGRTEATPPPPTQLPVIHTEVLRWGEVMPEPGQLPELPNPAPQTQEPEVVELQEPDEEVVDLAPPERDERPVRERTEPRPERARAEHNPNRPINDAPIQGSPEGLPGGNSLSPEAQRNQLARIQAQLQNAFRPPRAIPDSELRRLSAQVRVRVSPAGQVTSFDLVRSSGNRLFDAAALSAVNRFRMGSDRLDISTVTNQGIRAALERDGFVLTIREP